VPASELTSSWTQAGSRRRSAQEGHVQLTCRRAEPASVKVPRRIDTDSLNLTHRHHQHHIIVKFTRLFPTSVTSFPNTATLFFIFHKRLGVSHSALDWFSSYQSVSRLGHTSAVGPDQPSSTSLNCGVPQGSIVRPREFISYTADNEELIHSHSLACHLYAYDTQLLCSMLLEEFDSRKPVLECCVSSVQQWCARWRLQLNEDMSELIWSASRYM